MIIAFQTNKYYVGNSFLVVSLYRQILNRIQQKVKEDGERRIRNKQETDELLKHKDTVTLVKALQTQRLCHLERLDEERMPKESLRAQVCKSRKRGQPRICLLYTSRCV